MALPLVSMARKVNENKVSKVVDRFLERVRDLDATTENEKKLIIGFAYKKNSADIRNTKVANIVKELKIHGYKVDVYDPLVNKKSSRKNVWYSFGHEGRVYTLSLYKYFGSCTP